MHGYMRREGSVQMKWFSSIFFSASLSDESLSDRSEEGRSRKRRRAVHLSDLESLTQDPSLPPDIAAKLTSYSSNALENIIAPSLNTTKSDVLSPVNIKILKKGGVDVELLNSILAKKKNISKDNGPPRTADNTSDSGGSSGGGGKERKGMKMSGTPPGSRTPSIVETKSGLDKNRPSMVYGQQGHRQDESFSQQPQRDQRESERSSHRVDQSYGQQPHRDQRESDRQSHRVDGNYSQQPHRMDENYSQQSHRDQRDSDRQSHRVDELSLLMDRQSHSDRQPVAFPRDKSRSHSSSMTTNSNIAPSLHPSSSAASQPSSSCGSMASSSSTMSDMTASPFHIGPLNPRSIGASSGYNSAEDPLSGLSDEARDFQIER